ncbi:hypothetical protein UC34_07115 [Pandoraea vervacti]|uniref:SnoaL-like domain-containing protein n=1 Tax=Pandoraea vervacti TaxID=656178 RepID=A0ABM5T3I7_9BURK|nr:nuclear transport factor 2 family protein [Pandoraea vervacti]AJP59517.1 hypothetical protein UC34_07115 [Pandoraea vervacti]
MNTDDYRQIQNLLYRYAHLLDTGRWEALGALFEHADVYIAGELAASKNPSQLTALWNSYVRRYPNGTPRTHHIITNVTIENDGEDRARSHCYVLVVQQGSTLGLQPVIAGDYLDRFQRVEGVWRFTERHIGNELFGNLSEHLLLPMQMPDDRLPQSWD